MSFHLMLAEDNTLYVTFMQNLCQKHKARGYNRRKSGADPPPTRALMHVQDNYLISQLRNIFNM